MSIGSVTVPSGAAGSNCNANEVFVQPNDDPGTSWTVPAGGGAITAWQTNTLPDAPGEPLTLLVLRPGSQALTFTIVGSDSETMPSPLPAGGIASFAVNPPIETQPGDLLGLDPGPDGTPCLFHAGATPGSDTVLFSDPVTSLATGTAVLASTHTPNAWVLNAAATLDNDEDAGISASAGPANATAGSLAQLSALVTNHGPAFAPITFTGAVPAGLTIDSAVAGGGSCAVSGQTVSCTLTVAPGTSAPVAIAVTPPAAGNYGFTATVGVTGFVDPTAADNTAGATLRVRAAASPAKGRCQVPPLAKTPIAIAKRVLALLGCTVGKTTKVASKRVAKGLVVGTKPKTGSTLAAGARVKLVVSSGPPRKRRRH